MPFRTSRNTRLIVATLAAVSVAQAEYTFSRILGGGGIGLGTSVTALSPILPYGAVWDHQGRWYFIAGGIFRVNQIGVIDQVVGNGSAGFGGDGGQATADGVAFGLYGPSAVVVDSSNNLYIADSGNHRVRKVDAVTGIISTIAGTGSPGSAGDGGPATSAQLNVPLNLALDLQANLYVGDRNSSIRSDSSRVRKIALATGIITTVAGYGFTGNSGDGGPAINAAVTIDGLAADGAGNLYISDSSYQKVRKVTAVTGLIDTIAGTGWQRNTGDNGPASNAALLFPEALAYDYPSGSLFISTQGSVRKVNALGIISTIAGNGTPGKYSGEGGPATQATLSRCDGLANNSLGDLFCLSWNDLLALKIDHSTSTISTWVGNPAVFSTRGDGGPAGLAFSYSVSGLALGTSGEVFVADPSDSRVRMIVPATTMTDLIDADSKVSTYAGNGYLWFDGDGGPAISAALGNFSMPIPVATDPAGHLYLIAAGGLYVTKPVTRIRSVSNGIISTIGGGGISNGRAADGGLATGADLSGAQGIAADRTDVYLSDGSGDIRKINVASGIISTFAQNVRASAIDLDASGNLYFISGSSIGKIATGTGVVSIIAGAYLPCGGVCDTTLLGLYSGAQLGDGGPAANATLNNPKSVKVDHVGNIFVADTGAHRVRMISAGTGIITTLSGTNAVGCSKNQGPATKSLFVAPSSLAVNSSGVIYVGDSECGLVSKLTTTPPVTSYTGYVDSANCLGVSGWAADKDRLGQSITVSIYDNTTLLGTAIANQSRSDVGAVLGDNGLHGFSYVLPGGLNVGSQNIRVVYESSAVELAGSPRVLTCAPTYTGYIDAKSCSGISGWIADRARLNQALMVTLWDGSTQIASTTANTSRSDVGSFLGDNGLHGFSLPIPTAYANGAAHALQLRYESSSIQLPGSPFTLTCGGGPNYAGYVDNATCSGINGWAADKSRLNQPITVTLWDGATQIASTTANGSRGDVGGVLGDNGLHGFALLIPAGYANGVSHNLQVHYETSPTPLPGATVTLTCGGTQANYAGWVDSASCSGINGWAADKARLNQPITVSLWDGATQIASTTANASRADVGGVLGDNGLHGYSMPIPAGYSNGVSHTLQIRYETSATQLPRSPAMLTCGGSAGADYTGWVENLSCSAISGWAADRNALNTSVSVNVYDGATLLTTAPAASSRADVGGVLGDNGLHGFGMGLALSKGAHTIAVHPVGSSVVLSGPQVLKCP